MEDFTFCTPLTLLHYWHCWHYCTLFHTIDTIAHYWHCCTLLTLLHTIYTIDTIDTIAHYFHYCTLLTLLYTIFTITHYWHYWHSCTLLTLLGTIDTIGHYWHYCTFRCTWIFLFDNNSVKFGSAAPEDIPSFCYFIAMVLSRWQYAMVAHLCPILQYFRHGSLQVTVCNGSSSVSNIAIL